MCTMVIYLQATMLATTLIYGMCMCHNCSTRILIDIIDSAEINAMDIFRELFALDPRSRTAWTRFRQIVLEPGGSGNDLDIIKAILGGRLPNTQALCALLKSHPV
jgi:hypothetical protein